MGEGAALFVLKRLADAERAGDRIYAVVRGIAGSSDGTGKGITAPNPIGQRLAVERAWANAGLSPVDVRRWSRATAPRPRVGDVVEVESLAEVFGEAGVAPGSVALGSVKSNIGHLKGAAGAAGLLKTVAGAAPQGPPAEPRLRAAEPEYRLGQLRRSASTPSCATGSRAASARRRASARSASAAPTSTPCSRSTSPAG